VQVLTSDLAPKFPAFKAGQVLISCRHLSTMAVLDVDKGSVVWAARGPWQGQHDPHFLDNGRLLLFDNRGRPTGSRVLEYDPATQGFPWSYSGENWRPLYSNERGMTQRLPNGNTLVVNSEGGEILEVAPAKKSCGPARSIVSLPRPGGTARTGCAS
jgi:arylsulfotransferase ASST